MNDNDFKQKTMFKLGGIEAEVKSIKDVLTDIKTDVANNTKKVNKHEVVFGKLGVIVTAVLFIFATGINFIVDWVRSKF